MVGKDPAETAGKERPILPWRLVAGAFLHFIIPIYLVAALVDWQWGAGPGPQRRTAAPSRNTPEA